MQDHGYQPLSPFVRNGEKRENVDSTATVGQAWRQAISHHCFRFSLKQLMELGVLAFSDGAPERWSQDWKLKSVQSQIL